MYMYCRSGLIKTGRGGPDPPEVVHRHAGSHLRGRRRTCGRPNGDHTLLYYNIIIYVELCTIVILYHMTK